MPYTLTAAEVKQLRLIEEKYYTAPALEALNALVADELENDWRQAFDHLYSLMIETKPAVDTLLQERVQRGEIRDINQARKSVVGNLFSVLIVFVFLKNKEAGYIRSDVFISSTPKRIKGFNEIATVNVADETQKPDIDLLIYAVDAEGQLTNCIILSLKTSLRERAGQTYKWKLLMEIAGSENSVKDKYDISYSATEPPLVCFATVNFYDEVNSPQHRGMFKFFDKAFIAKPIQSDFISPMSELIDYVNEQL